MISALLNNSSVFSNLPTMIEVAVVVLIDLSCLPSGFQTLLNSAARFVNLQQPQNNSSSDENQHYRS